MDTFLTVLAVLAVAVFLGMRTMHAVGNRPERAGSRLLGFLLLLAIVAGATVLFRSALSPWE